jgi:hypothetical protein
VSDSARGGVVDFGNDDPGVFEEDDVLGVEGGEVAGIGLVPGGGPLHRQDVEIGDALVVQIAAVAAVDDQDRDVGRGTYASTTLGTTWVASRSMVSSSVPRMLAMKYW